MSSDVLKKAIELTKAGKKADAQKLLEPLIESDKENITAWLWYVETWPSIQQKVKVLEMCLQYNPDNDKVKQALTTLRSRLSSPSQQGTPFVATPRQEIPRPRVEVKQGTLATANKPQAEQNPISPKPAVSDQQLLQQYISRQTRQGWQIISQNESSVQLKKPKSWSRTLLILGLVFLVFAGTGLIFLILAIIDYVIKKEQVIFVTAADLRTETVSKPSSSRRSPLILAGVLIGSFVICIGFTLLSATFLGRGNPSTNQPAPALLPTVTVRITQTPAVTVGETQSSSFVSLATIRQEVMSQLASRDLMWSDTEVEVVNGRPTGGDKAILIKYNTLWPYDSKEYWEDVGGCFGAAGAAMLKYNTDFDSVFVIMGDHDTELYLETYTVSVLKLIALMKGQITGEEFYNSLQIASPP